MKNWKWICGSVTIKLICADTLGFLQTLQKLGIIISDVIFLDCITVQFSVTRNHLKTIKRIGDKRGYSVEILQEKGMITWIKALKKRFVLLLGVMFLLFLSFYIPSKVLFVLVEGNSLVPTRQILSAAENCGVRFGAARKDIRSEQVKNELLGEIPELKWAGVNTFGCVATIRVQEREQEIDKEKQSVMTGIVAARDGVISELTVTKGTAVCKPGQAIKAGQLLISGYTDCGIVIQFSQPEGEVFAATNRELTVLSPTKWDQRGAISCQSLKISLILGKKRINFYKGSGISDTTCVKIYEEKKLSLPGGFILPVSLVVETWIEYEEAVDQDTSSSSINLERYAEGYLNTQMISGKILSRIETRTMNEDVMILSGRYACNEMIGVIRNEETVNSYGNS